MFGPQYRSIILTQSGDQAATARAVIAEIEKAGIWDGRVVTEVVPEAPFWPAEPEHHDYFARNPWTGYCRAVVAPKVAKFARSSPSGETAGGVKERGGFTPSNSPTRGQRPPGPRERQDRNDALQA